jgi:hypothetical protein
MKTQSLNPSINGILPPKAGAWDITKYPFGGDFMRAPENGIHLRIIGPCEEKPGWTIAECERPNMRGIRTIVSNQIQSL